MRQYGFTLLRERDIPELASRARLWRHDATGAELISVLNADENKVFSANFRTPPRDSTGVAHILEHSVLCGSRRFPVKEPFVELIKGSLNTFVNAFTYPDRTCYPVASCHPGDLQNLIQVYLDAVFHPLIPEHVFAQEGWHWELERGILTRKGVVYNEMKGAYSSPEGLLSELSQQCLFPDTTYGLDSGGHPDRIPDLTYAAFKEFHRRFYHPSNCRFWFSGDDPEPERLAVLEAALAGFAAQPADSEVGLQAPFAAPRERRERFAAGPDAQGMFTVNWLLPEAVDQEASLGFEMLEHVLTGLPTSPLRLALLESGLGEDLAGTGLENELRQMYFSCGLKGCDPQDAPQAWGVMREVLARLAAEGPSAAEVEAALNTVEFDLRENNTGRFPRGLSLMLRAMPAWLYGGDPLEALGFAGPLERIKSRLAAGEPLFADLVKRRLVDNPHRVTLVLEPEPGLDARREAEEGKALAAVLGAMPRKEQEAVAAAAAELARIQSAPDDPAALAAIPRLTLADMPRAEKPIPAEARPGAAELVLTHDLDCAGIVYLDLGFDLAATPLRLLPLAPLFGRALTEMGTRRTPFEELSLRIARTTGGIEADPLATGALGPDGRPAGAAVRLFVHGKAVAGRAQDMLDILAEILAETDFADQERFGRMVLEDKARMEHGLIPGGHRVVMTRLRAGHGPAGLAAEHLGGVSALLAMRELSRRVEEDWPGVLADLETLRSLIVTRAGLVANLTASAGDLAAFEPRLAKFLEGLPAASHPAAVWAAGPAPRAEGLTAPSMVNYVGQVLDLRATGWDFHGSTLALTNLARTGHLWEKVRVQGGAYGAFCTYDRFTGAMSFASYRDPNLGRTLDAFAATADFLRSAAVSPGELEKGIIGAVGDLDAHLLPDAKGFASLVRRLAGDTPDNRQRLRDELLSAGPAHAAALADAMHAALPAARIAVLGSRQAITGSGLGFEVTEVMG
ncbi:MAG: insulinase family protein [Thermodesulfobacteriota bacterium]